MINNNLNKITRFWTGLTHKIIQNKDEGLIRCTTQSSVCVLPEEIEEEKKDGFYDHLMKISEIYQNNVSRTDMKI